MIYKITVPINKKRDGKWNKTPSLNEYIKAERTVIYSRNGKHLTAGANMKRQWQKYMATYIDNDMKGKQIDKPVIIHYKYFEPDHRRDWSNVHAPFCKFFEDALQDCKVLKNDNQHYIFGFTADFQIDSTKPRVEVEIEETTTDFGFNPYQE